MRIQHNIMAMNSYRNYTNNTSALSKNLEKLSSGYRINRAGDDAAGLAISEKMRAQITGLATAQKNAKSGINLVQTAEGALTEVHDMLNRMVELADQSANGTYDNEVDRANLQKEFDQLRSEIDRIADSSNFNGIKLLDGSLSAAGAAGKNGSVEADLSKLGLDLSLSAEDVKAVQGSYQTNAMMNSAAIAATGDGFTFTMKFTDADGKEQTITKTLFTKGNTGAVSNEIWLDDGTEDGVKLTTTMAAGGTMTSADVANAMKEVLEKDDTFKANFTMTISTDKSFIFQARTPGTEGAKVESVGLKYNDSTDKTGASDTQYATKVDTVTAAADAIKSYDFTQAKVWGSNDTDTGVKDLADAIFEVNGKKFAFVNAGTLDSDQLAKLKEAGVEHWVQVAADNGDVTAATLKTMAEKIAKETGLDVEQGANAAGVWTKDPAAGTKLIFKSATSNTAGTGGGGLTLQIGDTAEDFNQLTVSVDDMHTKALGLADISIADQANAKSAVDTIRNAINSVSSTRGTLGALQNRLDHTINNLSVMQENIQDAESSIRDTDVADEMMAYTKNNILVQSAQAMLAQANQIPQGVLQLLQ